MEKLICVVNIGKMSIVPRVIYRFNFINILTFSTRVVKTLSKIKMEAKII